MPANSITDYHHVLPIFCNTVVGSGTLNGVVNLTLGVALFTPQGAEIDPDVVICCRLRMDMACLETLYQQIGQMLTAQKPTDEKPN